MLTACATHCSIPSHTYRPVVVFRSLFGSFSHARTQDSQWLGEDFFPELWPFSLLYSVSRPCPMLCSLFCPACTLTQMSGIEECLRVVAMLSELPSCGPSPMLGTAILLGQQPQHNMLVPPAGEMAGRIHDLLLYCRRKCARESRE